jgi:hypothetical protein
MRLSRFRHMRLESPARPPHLPVNVTSTPPMLEEVERRMWQGGRRRKGRNVFAAWANRIRNASSVFRER